MYMMDKNEVITLSSDDEGDFVHRLECNLNSSTTVKPCSKNSSEILKSYLEKFDRSSGSSEMGVIIKSNKNEVKIMKLPRVLRKNFKGDIKESPELVDLVDCIEKPNDNSQCSEAQCSNHELSKTMQVNNHSELDIICIDENAFSTEKKSDVYASMGKEDKKDFHDLPLENIKINEENNTSDVINSTSKSLGNNNKIDENKADGDSNQNLKFFTEFVEFCGSLEKIPNDRARLTKKLMKRYGEADCSYIKSQEFRNLIQKCRNKVTMYNLYLIAKEITDELSYRKKFEISTVKLYQIKRTKGKSQPVVEKNEKVQGISGKRAKNRTKFINKIVKNLDKLGNKIRELEIKEVDLSDEEESSYVQLQRYRERFCQIYTKLCKYTNEVADADRFYGRKICFTESKYPAINKCIENWLNKTKTFPDFSDIMKLLESQSSSLGFPTNRESNRVLAMEIFQQVGAMLQRRRMYDLWDSFCGFLDEGEDPANSDPILDEVLKSNFEARIKKEQEIFQHFAELQEKERLEPEEVPDEEANRSPVESGNEDYKEIEDIENFLNRKLDDAIKKETEEKGNTSESNAWDTWGGSGNDLENKAQSHHSLNLENTITTPKESKNNFRNCKSLKWRLEGGGKVTSVNSEEGDAETENEKERETGNPKSDISEVIKPNNFDSEECKKSEENEKNYSNLDLIVLENTKLKSNEVCSKIIAETTGGCLSPSKRPLIVEDKDKNQIPKKKKCTSFTESKSDFEILNINDKNDSSKENTKKVFNVHWCQIFTDNTFENLNEKEKGCGKRKVFRDLTNVNRLMELHGKRKKLSGLYSPLFFHRSFCEFEKSSWKKRFKVSFRFVGSKDQNCALNQEEKSRKTINSDKDVEKKNIQNNSESGRNDQGENFFSGHGNGREEDNNEDKNKKNGRSTEDVNENQFEEDEDEEENEAEKDDNKIDTETAELSFPNKKTEKPLGMNQISNIPSDVQNNSNENEESIRLSNMESKTSASGSKSENENKNENEEKLEKKTPFTGRRSKRESQKNDRRFNKETHKSKVKVSKSENKKDVGNIKGKDEELEGTKSASKIVRRNSKADAKYYTTEVEKSTLVRPNVKIESSDIVSNEKLNENADIKIESDIRTQLSTGPSFVESKDEIELITQDKRRKAACRGTAEVEVRRRASVILKKNENVKAQTVTRETSENKSAKTWKSVQLDMTSQKLQRKNLPSPSDEEIVKRFLMYSPASISITPPRKLSLSKPPSQAALQALATLRNLKGISTTVVRSKPKNEDDVVFIGGSYKTHTNQNSNVARRRRTDLPVISSVQSIDSTTPQIVTVQGNVSGFENSWPETSNSSSSECNSSSIRISNVWGSLPDNFMQSPQSNESCTPGCSSRQSNPSSSNSVKKKNTKKTVEYVVLE